MIMINIDIVLDVYVTEDGMFLKNIIVHHFKQIYILVLIKYF